MTTSIWILKGVIATLFIFAGSNKLLLAKAQLLNKGMKGLINLDERQIKISGLLEVLGAIGLILPSLLNYYPLLSAISALCLAFTMIVAGLINSTLKLSIIPNIIIFSICIFILYWELK